MEKRNNHYGLRMVLREYTNKEEIVSIDLFDYFELTSAERILTVNEYFTDKLKRYLENHNITKKDWKWRDLI